MQLSDREAAAAIALMAMYADDHIAAEEDATIRERLMTFPLFDHIGEAELGDILSRLERLIRKEGREAVYRQSLAALEAWARPTTFLLVAEIIAADGDVLFQESKYLQRLRADLAIPEETARHVFEVTKIRYVKG